MSYRACNSPATVMEPAATIVVLYYISLLFFPLCRSVYQRPVRVRYCPSNAYMCCCVCTTAAAAGRRAVSGFGCRCLKLNRILDQTTRHVTLHHMIASYFLLPLLQSTSIMAATTAISIPKPADFHVHLRQGDLSALVTPHVRKGGFRLAYVMVPFFSELQSELY